MSKTVPPLVSLLPISRSAGRPLLIKKKKNLDDPNTSFILGCITVQLYSRPFSIFIPGRVTVHLYSQQFSFIPSRVTVQLYSWPCYCSALFPAISSFIPDCVRLPVDHCLDHNKGFIRQHWYCVYRRLRSESARVTALIATGAGKGRNARQSWRFTK